MHDRPMTPRVAWMQRVLSCLDDALSASQAFDAARLAQALAPVSAWDGCPASGDIFSGGQAAYRRMPLACNQALGYEALLIAWPPGHVTPIHDHAGLAGLVLVLDGSLEEEAFILSKDARLHLAARQKITANAGGCLLITDADQAHRCRNPSLERTALSLHVYGGRLDSYRSFHEEDGHWAATMQHSMRDPWFG